MLTASLFRPTDLDIEALVREHPFGLLVSTAAGVLNATPLPLLLERDSESAWSLLGHFARSNPQTVQLENAPRALVVFQGPHGYISPSWMRDRTQAPTWNFATVHFHVEVTFDPSAEAALDAVGRLTSAMEAGRPNIWAPHELGDRHPRLARGVVAFRARVVEVNAKFKLGQNERDDVLVDILGGLQGTGQHGLADAMREANSSRGRASDPVAVAAGGILSADPHAAGVRSCIN